MNLVDLLSSLVSAGALGLVAGGGREIIRLIGYGIEQKTQRERDRLIAQNPEAAAALNASPISKPPSVGPLAVLLPLAMVTGAAAGPMVRPAVEVATSAAECRKNSDCGSGCTCNVSSGKCSCATIERKPPPKSEPRTASATASYRDYAGEPFWGPLQPIDSNPALDRQ